MIKNDHFIARVPDWPNISIFPIFTLTKSQTEFKKGIPKINQFLSTSTLKNGVRGSQKKRLFNGIENHIIKHLKIKKLVTINFLGSL